MGLFSGYVRARCEWTYSVSTLVLRESFLDRNGYIHDTYDCRVVHKGKEIYELAVFPSFRAPCTRIYGAARPKYTGPS